MAATNDERLDNARRHIERAHNELLAMSAKPQWAEELVFALAYLLDVAEHTPEELAEAAQEQARKAELMQSLEGSGYAGWGSEWGGRR